MRSTGAKKCAIEFRSFSKTAGFTGTRCAYTVVPKELQCGGVSLNALWLRRQTTKFNGVPYIVQKGGSGYLFRTRPKGNPRNHRLLPEQCQNLREGLAAAGFTVYGGVNAPYIWMKTPDNMTSWGLLRYPAS